MNTHFQIDMKEIHNFKTRYRFNPVAWICYIRNRFFPYIALSWQSFVLSLCTTYFASVLYIIATVYSGNVVAIQGKLLTLLSVPWILPEIGKRFFIAIFFTNCFITVLRELGNSGVIFSSKKRRNRIKERKILTASAIYESLSLIESYKIVDPEIVKNYRMDVLNLIKSNLESYFGASQNDPKSKIAVALIEVSDDPREYTIVARDSDSFQEGRQMGIIPDDQWTLSRPVETINNQKVYVTDNVSADYDELGKKSYQSVITVPLLKYFRNERNEIKKYCFGAISIDFTKKYRFRGAEQEIETNIKPYYTLLFYTFRLGKMQLNV